MTRTHAGGCHCGRVRFEVIAPAAVEVDECDCSICSKVGFLHLIVAKEHFKLLSGNDALTTYTFNTGVAKHLFCKTCGVKSFYIPRSHPGGVSVNARCIDAGSIESMTVRPFDGRNWEKGLAQYLAPECLIAVYILHWGLHIALHNREISPRYVVTRNTP